MGQGTVIAVTLAILAVIGLLFRVKRPEDTAPIRLDPDDPLMLAAREMARHTLPEFALLFRMFPNKARLRIRFTVDDGVVESLWAEAVEEKDVDAYTVRLLNSASARGAAPRLLTTCTAEEIEDWQVTDDKGTVHGGFTQRAMFTVARRDSIKLSPKLEKMAAVYEERFT